MSARITTRKKLFCQGKAVKESLDRKPATGVGWNKYLDLRMTQGSLLSVIKTNGTVERVS